MSHCYILEDTPTRALLNIQLFFVYQKFYYKKMGKQNNLEKSFTDFTLSHTLLRVVHN
jgi:hypothetical protein